MATLDVQRPSDSSQAALPVESGSSVQFRFDTSDTSFERVDGDLVLSFDDGSQITLEGFFTRDEGVELPNLILSDGTEINAADFLLALDPDFNVLPAEGPSAGNGPNSSGGSYADETGDLLGGVDRLGSLGTDYWARATDQAVTVDSLLAAEATSTPGPVDPGTPDPGPGPGPGPGPEPEPSKYAHSRLIVTNDESGSTYKFFAQDSEGNLLKGADAERVTSVAFKEGVSDYFTISFDPVSGEITVTLTQAGKDALARGERFDDMLLVTVDGEDYAVDLYARGDDDSYDWENREQETDDRFVQPLLGEWYASNGKSIESEEITLGGTGYNQADVIKEDTATVTAVRDSHIEIVDGKSSLVNIEAVSQNGEARGLETSVGGSSSIVAGVAGKTDSDVTISARSENGSAYGVDALGNTDIYASRVDVQAHGKNESVGIRTGATAATVVNADESININASSSSSHAKGVNTAAGGTSELSAKDITITAHGQKETYGVNTEGNGKTILQGSSDGGSTITVSAESETGRAFGIDGDTQVRISDDNNLVDISARSKAGTGDVTVSNTYAMDGGASITLDGGDNNTIRVSAVSDNGEARAVNRSTIDLTGNENTVDISATGARKAIGLDGGSKMSVNGDGNTVNISVETTNTDNIGNTDPTNKAPWQAHGMWGSTIDSTGNDNTINIDATSAGYGEAYGMSASKINATGTGRQDINISATNNNETLNANRNSDSRAIGMRDSSIKHEGEGTIHIVAEANNGEAIGMFTDVKIDAANADLVIDSHSTNGKAQGIAAWQWANSTNGHNDVTAKDITINVSQDASEVPNNGWPLDAGVYGISARHEGTNKVTAKGDLNIKASSDAETLVTTTVNDKGEVEDVWNGVYGLEATGKNTLNQVQAGSLNIETSGKAASAYGLFADDGRQFYDASAEHKGGRNIVTVDKDATISAKSESGDAYGAYALGDSAVNSLSAGGDVSISSESATGTAYGLKAGDGGSNEISSGGDISIEAKSGRVADAIRSDAADGRTSSNTLIAQGDINIDAKGSSARGLTADANNDGQASITLTSRSGDIDISASGTSGTAAIGAYRGGKVEVTAEQGSISLSAHGGSVSHGIMSQTTGSSVSLDAKGDISISASNNTNSSGGTHGIHANLGGLVDLRSKEGDISISAETRGTGGSATVMTGNYDTLTIDAEKGSVILEADGNNAATGIHGGATITAGKDVSMTVNSSNGHAEGIHAIGRSTADITAGGKVDIDVTGKTATGIYSYDRSVVDITANEVSVSATATEGNALGLRATGLNPDDGTKLVINADEGVTVEARSEGTGGAYGVYVERGASTEINGKSVDVSAASNAYAAGMYVLGDRYDSDLTINASEDVSVNATGTYATGVYVGADDNGAASLSVEAGSDVSITANGAAGANALSVEAAPGSEASIEITAEKDINITALGGNDYATAMYAGSDSGGSVRVDLDAGGSVTVSAQAEGEAYGLSVQSWDDADTSVNINARDNLTISAQGGGYAAGIHVNGHDTSFATVNLTSETGDITIKANSDQDGAAGIYANQGGQIEIRAEEGSINVSSHSDGREANGITSQGNETWVNLEAREDITVSASTNTALDDAAAYAIDALNGGRVSLRSEEGDINISAKANGPSGYAYGAGGNYDTLRVEAQEGSIHLDVSGPGEAVGMYRGGTYSAGKDVTMTVKSDNADAYGIWAHSDDRVEINAGGKVELGVDGVSATGILAHNNSSVEINAYDSVSIKAGASEGDAVGLKADTNGTVSIRGEEEMGYDENGDPTFEWIRNTNVAVEASAKGDGNATGIQVSQEGRVEVTPVKELNVTATAEDGAATGISVSGSYSEFAFGGDTLNISATANGDATGVLVEDQGSLNIRAEDGTTINATSDEGTATGFHARSGGDVGYYSQNSIDVTASGKEGATGILIEDQDTQISWQGAGKIDIKANSSNGQATGLHVAGGATANLTAEEISILTEGLGDTRAIHVEGGSNSYVNSFGENAKGSVSATSRAGVALAVQVSGEDSNLDLSANIITAQGSTGAYGLRSEEGANLTVRGANDGEMLVGAETVTGVAEAISNATNDGHSRLGVQNEGDIRIEARSGEAARGIVAYTGDDPNAVSDNGISSGGNISIKAEGGAGDGIGVWANANAGEAGNQIQADGNINIEASSETYVGYGLLAETTTGKASNSLQAEGDVTVKAVGQDQARAMSAIARDTGNAENEIISGGNVGLSATATDRDAIGMHAISHDGGMAENRITAEGDLTIRADGGTDASGIYATTRWNDQAYGQEAANTVTAKNITVEAVAGGNAYGLRADTQEAHNEIIAEETLKVTVTGGTSATGISAQNGATTAVTAKDVDITATGAGAQGIDAQSGGQIEVNAENVSISSTSNYNTSSYGIRAMNGQVDVKASGDVDITTVSDSELLGHHGYGIAAQKGGSVNVEARNVTVDVNATNLGYGLYGWGADTEVNIQAEENVQVDVSSTGGFIYGVNTTEGAKVNVEGKNVDINALSQTQDWSYGASYALQADAHLGDGSAITINADEKVTLRAGGVGSAIGSEAYGGGSVDIRAAEVEINASSKEGMAKGMSANSLNYAGDSSNSITADSVTINATSESGTYQAYGMFAQTNASGGAATNSITAANVEINATNVDGGSAFVMRAVGSDAVNEIKSADGQQFSVTLTATAGSLNKAIAVAAESGMNIIDGRTSSGSDITINGRIQASGNGSNWIYGSETGDNSITLNGKVTGALYIYTNGDHDILTLTASSYLEFMDFYQSWLNNCVTNGYLSGVNDLVVDIDGLDADIISKLHSYLDTLNLNVDTILFNVDGQTMTYDEAMAHASTAGTASGASAQVDLPQTEADDPEPAEGPAVIEPASAETDLWSTEEDLFSFDADANLEDMTISVDTNVLNLDGGGFITLSSLMEQGGGFEIIDLHGGSADMLSIDSVLDGLEGTTLQADRLVVEEGSITVESLTNSPVLRIHGDAEDTIVPGEGWSDTSVATVTYDGQSYEVYRNDMESETQYVLMQIGITVG